MRIEVSKADAINSLIDDIERELSETNQKIRNTENPPFNVTGLNEYPDTTGGKSLKMKKHHKKHLKRKTRKIRNKKHKSK